MVPISTNDFFMTRDEETNLIPALVMPSLQHLEQVDFDSTMHTDDNLQAMSLLIMFAER